MKILFLTFYYTPDLCAGSFRSSALIEKLSKLNVDIEIITTMPNRYSTFSAHAEESERCGNVIIHRVPLPNHNSGMLDQIIAFFTYYKAALRIIKDQQYDSVFSTSSRLFTAFLGARISRKKNIPLYLDIRDIFVDTIKDVLPSRIALITKPIFSLIEKYSFSRAGCINLVSEGFREYFEARYSNIQFRWFTNGIDDTFLKYPISESSLCKDDLVTVLYAGNIGEGQGLHGIVPSLAKKLEGKARIKIIGAGGRLAQLEKAVADIDNVEIFKPVAREELLRAYSNSDVLFLHLNDYPAFEKVLPSKIFEYAAMGKPILAGVSGYSAEFLERNVSNVGIFYPTNDKMALDAFNSLELKTVKRTEFNNKFSRASIMTNMAADIYRFSRGEMHDH
ncbi:putative glycosyl transferase [Vibrio campbellii]|uniref:glycosyltransferase family 4 protein n=1 Tax=Vibrio campbellii TaxID=680 RepID=UPI00097FB5BF|nr:glycosyltransferase family 4 protein [Vibrio campbellii]AQM68231.1 putative glycosyl transferase [Vibrio campbellii]